jgi:hypothetical protein
VGVVGLALIAALIYFLIRRRRGQRRPESDPGSKGDPSHYSGSTFQSPGPASPAPNMQQAPTVPYIATQDQGIEHYPHPYASNNVAMPLGGYIPPESAAGIPPNGYPAQEYQAAVPLGGYLPQDDPENAPRPAYQSWPPIHDQHWQTAQGLQVSAPTSTASPPDSRYGDGYSSPGSQTGLRPSELHANQGWEARAEESQELQGGQPQQRWELGAGRQELT